MLNTEVYVDRCTADPRYAKEKNAKPPKKIGSHLELFDCITCDKCVPVCPNDANFTFDLPRIEVPVVKLSWDGAGWDEAEAPSLVFEKKHQIGTYADFCNECGNCDVFCPEDGGPYIVKPRFFGTPEDWRELSGTDGLYLERVDAGDRVLGRFSGVDYTLEVRGDAARFEGPGFAVDLHVEGATDSVVLRSGDPGLEIDLTWFHVMNWLRKGVLGQLNYVSLRQPRVG